MAEERVKIDVLLTGATVVTMDAQRRVLENGAVAIRGAEIVWAGAAEDAAGLFTPAQTVTLAGMMVTPGLVNAHGHWAMTIFRGLVDDLPLDAWLNTIWKVEAAAAIPEHVTAGARLAMIEMLRSGTTCAADMYWHFRNTTEAAREAGFRIVNGPSFAEIAGFEGHSQVTIAGAAEYVERYRDDPLVQLCIQTHATYTTDVRMMVRARELAEENQLTFITHASESQSEMKMVSEKYDGKTPIEVLDSVGLLGPRTLLAHAVHLSDAEIARLAETGTSVAHCPSSNLKLASGIARVTELLRAGVNVAIGTDGPASNNDLDLFHEAQLAALVQKGVTGDPTALPAERVFEMLTLGGARAVGLGERVGSIEPGKLADLMVLDMSSPNLTPCYNLYSHLLYAAAAADVRHVMIHGRWVLRDRQALTIDEEQVKADVQRIAGVVREKL